MQRSPVYFNKTASLSLAEEILNEAGERSVDLVVFGETWFTGYPVWLDYYQKVGLWDYPATKKLFRRMCEEGIMVPGDETILFEEAASRYGFTIVLGCNEYINGTLYNTALTFTPEHGLANHHRKLMPTYTEKMLYGLGDGHGLKAVPTSFGRVTTAICWEHWMPLTRQALHQQGEDIHIALWPRVHEMHQIASRQYAFEGRCFVIAAGQMLHMNDMPDELNNDASLDKEWLLDGGSCIIRPDGHYDMEPQFGKNSVLYHQIEHLGQVLEERMTLEVTGHYSRPDVFHFHMDQTRQRSVR